MTTSMPRVRERERELLDRIDAHRFAAPNPRDFPSWEAFYKAQETHEREMARLEREHAALIEEAWNG